MIFLNFFDKIQESFFLLMHLALNSLIIIQRLLLVMYCDLLTNLISLIFHKFIRPQSSPDQLKFILLQGSKRIWEFFIYLQIFSILICNELDLDLIIQNSKQYAIYYSIEHIILHSIQFTIFYVISYAISYAILYVILYATSYAIQYFISYIQNYNSHKLVLFFSFLLPYRMILMLQLLLLFFSYLDLFIKDP